MESQKRKPLNFFKNIVESSTSSPALKKVLQAKLISQGIFWILVLGGSLTGLVYHIMDAASLYYSTPINTDMTERPAQLDDFPDLTFCKSMYSVSPHTSKQPPLPSLYNQTYIDYINKNFIYMLSIFNGLQKEKYSYNFHKLLLSTIIYMEKLIPFEYVDTIEKWLVLCELNEQRCDFRHFRLYFSTYYLNCYTFSLKLFMKTHNILPGKDTLTLKVMLNLEHGIKMMYKTYRDTVIQPFSLMKVHVPGTHPTVTSDVINERHIRQGYIKVQKMEANRLNLPKKPCIPEGSRKKSYTIIRPLLNISMIESIDKVPWMHVYNKYTRDDCLQDEMQKIIFDECECLNPAIPVSQYTLKHVLAINSKTKWCIENNFHEKYAKFNLYLNFTTEVTDKSGGMTFTYIDGNGTKIPILDELRGTEIDKRFFCLAKTFNSPKNLAYVQKKCLDFCFDEYYETKINFYEIKNANDPKFSELLKYEEMYVTNIIKKYESFKNRSIQPNFNETLLKQLCYFEIEFDLYKKVVSTELETYPLISFCSNIGGILGVWIGISILVIAEIVVVFKAVFASFLASNAEMLNSDSPQENEEESKPVNALHDFAESTSIHGINHLILANSLREYFLWFTLLVLCIVGLGFHAEMIISLFQSKPISTETIIKVDETDLPQITYCPVPSLISILVKSEQIKNHNRSPLFLTDPLKIRYNVLDILFKSLTRLQPQVANDKFIDHRSSYIQSSFIKRSMYDIMSDLDIEHLSHKEIYYTLFGCEISNMRCNSTYFKPQYHPIYRFCFNFNLPTNNHSRLGFPEEISLMIFSGDEVFNYKSHNSEPLLSISGGLLSVQQHRTYPTMKNYFSYYPIHTNMLSIKKLIYQMKKSIYYDCIEQKEEILMEKDNMNKHLMVEKRYQYNVELCDELMQQSYVISMCGCISPLLALSKQLYYSVKSLKFCARIPNFLLLTNLTFTGASTNNLYINGMKFNDYLLLFSEGKQLLQEYRCHFNVLTNRSIMLDVWTKCKKTCRRVVYQTDITQRMSALYDVQGMKVIVQNYKKAIHNRNISSLFPAKYFAYGLDRWNANHLSGINIVMKSSQIMITSQIFSYSIVGFLSDLGGILGLWFGFSIATFFEVVELIWNAFLNRKFANDHIK